MASVHQKEHWLFWTSIALICLMAPLIGFRYDVQVSAVFAFLMIMAARPQWEGALVARYIVFVGLVILARHSLCCWQPWVFLFDHGLYESSPAPFLIVSGSASLAVCILFYEWSSRLKYFLITLGTQTFFYLLLILEALDPVPRLLQTVFPVKTSYPAIWGLLQLQWMLVYYAVFYVLIRKETRPVQKSI